MASKRQALAELIASAPMPECVQHEVLLSFPQHRSALAANPWLHADVFAKLYTPDIKASEAVDMVNNMTAPSCIDVVIDASENRVSVLRPLLWRWELSTDQLSRLAAIASLPEGVIQIILEDQALPLGDRARISNVSGNELVNWFRIAPLDADTIATDVVSVEASRDHFDALLADRPDVAHSLASSQDLSTATPSLLEALTLAELTQSEMCRLGEQICTQPRIIALLLDRLTPATATRQALWGFVDAAGTTNEVARATKLPRCADWLDHDGTLTAALVDVILAQATVASRADMCELDASTLTTEQLVKAWDINDTFRVHPRMQQFRSDVIARVIAGEAGDQFAAEAEARWARFSSSAPNAAGFEHRERPAQRARGCTAARFPTIAEARERLTNYMGAYPVTKPSWPSADPFGGAAPEVGVVIAEELGTDRSAWTLLFAVVENFDGTNTELIDLAKSLPTLQVA